jgi:hypothetical protein
MPYKLLWIETVRAVESSSTTATAKCWERAPAKAVFSTEFAITTVL